MAAKPLILKRKPPTRIVRKPVRGQMPLELKPRVRLATRRKRARLIGVAAALLASLGLTIGASALSYHDRFAINDIHVTGTHALSAAVVESAFGSHVNDGIRHFFSRANIFFYPQSELREALLREMPLLQTVSFKRETLLSQAVTILVTEREPKYIWCESDCYFMDADGFIFMKATNPSGFLEFRGGLIAHQDPIGQIFMRGTLAKLVSLIDGLKAGGFTATSVTVENEHDLTLHLENGLLVKVVDDANPEQLGKNLNLVLSSEALNTNEIEYIDLRFGNRVYYRLNSYEQ